jgi:hypothetical protein
VGKPGGKRLLGRARRRWRDNIKKDLADIHVDWSGTGMTDLVENRDQWRALVNRKMNPQVP